MTLECIDYTSEQLDARVGACAADLNCTPFDNIPTQVHVSDKDKVEIRADMTTDVTAAPFVCPCDDYAGVDYSQATVEWTLTPATIGQENLLHSCDLPLPMAPEDRAPWSTLPYSQRYNRHVANLLRLQQRALKLRMGQMKRDIILYGKTHIEQKDKTGRVVSQNMIDFDRSKRLTLRLAGKASWDNVDSADPMSDLEMLEERLIDEGGSSVGRFLIGKNVWRYLRENAKIKAAACTNNCGKLPTNFDWTPRASRGVTNRGSLGDWEFVTINCTYRGEDGEMHDLIPPNAVVAIGEGDCGPRLLELYGAVQQINKKLPTKVFRWNEIDQSPRKRWQKFGYESHPLIASLNPNGSAMMYVLPEAL